MDRTEDRIARLQATVAGWKMLRTLRALPLDLDRVALIRGIERERLQDVQHVTTLIQDLGLNDEGLDEFPQELHRYAGQGLRIWQYPVQFSRYLIDLSRMQIGSYVEVGVRHGGTFIATAEYLERFRPLDLALGVDLLPCPSMADYGRLNPRARFVRVNSQSDEYRRLLAALGRIDLVFIDSFHEESARRQEIAAALDCARVIAVHDIAHDGVPGLRTVWNELKALPGFSCREYVEQYPSVGRSCMGIGLLIRKD
ncbi:MAG TPA: class I SAM-dependent methyltransferase [Pseudomonadota bacterium]|nr:class I SAM-dependent methyltransferase [Pseudomonadota bacterium]